MRVSFSTSYYYCLQLRLFVAYIAIKHFRMNKELFLHSGRMAIGAKFLCRQNAEKSFSVCMRVMLATQYFGISYITVMISISYVTMISLLTCQPLQN